MGFEPVTILAQFGIAVGLRALQSWLSDPPPDDRKGVFSSYPATAEGSPVPLVYGRVRVRQPVVYWYGIARKRKVSDLEGLGSGDPGDPGLVEHYGMCMLFAIGVPCGPNAAATGARLLAIFDGDTKYECNLGHGDTLQLFGALGVLGAPPTTTPPTPYHGTVQFFAGTSDQQLSDNAPINPLIPADQEPDLFEIGRFMKWDSRVTPGSTIVPGEIPGYRNVMLVALTGDHTIPIAGDDEGFGQPFLDAFYFGPSPSLPHLSFEAINQRPAHGTGSLSNGDECPITVVSDIITRSWAKLGLPSARVHAASFAAAAATLFSESHGVSIALDSSRQGRQVLQDLASQIGGHLYYDPDDDSVHVKLVRNDVDPDTCPSFGPQHVVTNEGSPMIDTIVGGYGVDQINRVTVRFNDRSAGYVDGTAVAFNEATAVVGDTAGSSGRVRTAPLEYPYVSNIGLARDIAERDLALLSCPLKKIHVTFNRLLDIGGTTNAALLRPGMGFKLSFPDHHFSDTIFRVVKVDPGQHGDHRVIVDAVLDHMRLGSTSVEPPVGTLNRTVPMPLANRSLTEAPRWMQLYLTGLGILTSADVQRILAVARPDDAASRFSVQTKPEGNAFYATDLTSRQFPPSGRIATAYAIEKEPYDNATGLVVEEMWPNDVVASAIFANSYTETALKNNGFTLILAGGELMMYESAADLGGGQWRLNNVWRGALDTKPRDHAVGELVYFIGYAFGGQLYIGKRGHNAPDTVLSAITIPELGFVIGSGDDPIDEFAIAKRCLLPLRVANLALAGKNITGGVQGVPAVANRFKSVATRIEEGLDIHASRRERQTSTIIKGDLADEAPIETLIQFLVRATKLGASAVTIATLSNAAITGTSGAAGLLVGAAGHGTIDVSVQTIRTVQAGEPGFPAGEVIESWDEPACRVVAPRWRNLLANSRFDYNALAPGWTSTGSGTASIANNSTSIPRDTTGFYVQEATRSAIIEQIVAVTGYLPRKMTGRLVYYQRNLNSDANDTVQSTLDPLDSAGASLGGTATQTVTAPTTSWERKNINIASLPALTDKLKVSFGWNEIGGGGTSLAEVGITECELILGQHLYDVLANPSFETGTTGSWTNVTNSFVVATAIASPSGNYAQGGAFANSEIRQDYTVVTGWEVGSTAVLRMWRAQTIASDTGNVVLEALNGGGSVITSTSTGAENLSTLNQWVRRTLELDIPVGTVTVRVRLVAVRTGGAGNSGACFDELVLSMHKTLDASYELALDFSEPTVQLAPRTWPAWYLAYPDLVAADLGVPIVFAGAAAGPSVCSAQSGVVKMRWADDVTRQPARMVGQFGDGVAAIDAYVFTRQTGGSALDYQSFAEDSFRIANPTSETSFTVIMLFDVDEVGFSVACGLAGRLDTDSGWEMGIDATGHVFAMLRGDGGDITATRAGSTVHDGAKHLAAVVYDAVAETLTIYDERGSDSVSTVGMGEIANLGQSTPFRIGRGRTTIATLPGMIGRVYVWQEALTGPQIDAHFTLGADPTGEIVTYSRTVAAWCAGIPDDDGETLSCLATDQVAIGYDADLTDDGGTGQGLAVQKATGNLVPSFDFAGASWVKDASTTLTQAIEDATGRLHGVTVVSPDTSNGFKLIGITVGAGAAIQLVFYARALTGTPTLALELMNASDVVKDTQTKVLSTSWKRYEVGFGGWDASSATCRIRFRSNSGSTTFDLTHVMFVAQGVEVPALIPNALASIGAVTAQLVETAPTQLNAEGELIAVGVATLQSPAQASIVTAKKNSGDGNRRELQIGASQVPQFDHFDSAGPTDVASEGTAIDWRELWTLRGRWCALGTLDNAANAFAGIVVTGSASSADYDRAATWTYDANVVEAVLINSGAQPAMTGYLRSITLRAREAKLP